MTTDFKLVLYELGAGIVPSGVVMRNGGGGAVALRALWPFIAQHDSSAAYSMQPGRWIVPLSVDDVRVYTPSVFSSRYAVRLGTEESAYDFIRSLFLQEKAGKLKGTTLYKESFTLKLANGASLVLTYGYDVTRGVFFTCKGSSHRQARGSF